MKTLLVIPARGGSKGIKRKNLRVVGGVPLIGYAIRNALAATRIDKVIVSTEDEEIAAVAKSLGAEVPFLRPAELAEDHVSLIPVVQHASRVMADDFGFDADVVGSLQPTAPMLGADRIDEAVAVMEKTNCDTVTAMCEIDHGHPYRAYTLADDGVYVPLIPEGETFLQKQDRPPFHTGTGGIYLRRRAVLDAWTGRDMCLGVDRRAITVTAEEAVNIDGPFDMLVFEALIRQRNAD